MPLALEQAFGALYMQFLVVHKYEGWQARDSQKCTKITSNYLFSKNKKSTGHENMSFTEYLLYFESDQQLLYY